MFRPLLRSSIPTRQFVPSRHFARIRSRTYTSKPPTSPSSPSSSTPTIPSPAPSARLQRLLSRTPRLLHRHILALSTAPISHITSFLLLHEITAIVPLFSLAAFFHYTHWLPSWFAEGAWVLAGVEKFGGYARRKGWIGEEERREAGREVVEIQYSREMEKEEDAGRHQQEEEGKGGEGGKVKQAWSDMKTKIGVVSERKDKAWNIGEGSVRIVVEFATAYAITKALLVPRIMFSVWATPAFARWTVVPVMARVGRLFGGKKKSGRAMPKGGDGKGT